MPLPNAAYTKRPSLTGVGVVLPASLFGGLPWTSPGRSENPLDRCQSTRPSEASMQNNSAGSATRKIRPSTTIGDEYLFGPIFVLQRTFFVSLHSSGGRAPG